MEPQRRQLELDQTRRFRAREVALVHVDDANGVEGGVDYVFAVGEVR